MSKNKNKLGSGIRLITFGYIIFAPIFLVAIFTNSANAILDCSMCHKTVPGNAAIKAINTIEISDQTCLRCHNSEYPPKSIGYNTHLAHVGKYSVNVDYLKRHPKAAESISCDDCHMNIGENCQNCHIKNIPHIEPPLGYNCRGCHGELDKLFQHPTISLKVHNIFGENSTKACTMCHNPDNMASLKLASGDIILMKDSHRLCFQCHSGYYNSWNSDQHYSNNTVPSDQQIRSTSNMGENIQEIRTLLENKWRQENTCVNCHNPHNPVELYQLPMVSPEKAVDVSIITMILYTIAALTIIGATIAGLIIKKRKLKLSDIKIMLLKLKLSDIKIMLLKLKLSDIKNIKLPKLKLPKISIPISVSVEKLDKFEEKERIEHVDEVWKEKRADVVGDIPKEKRVDVVDIPKEKHVGADVNIDDVWKTEHTGVVDNVWKTERTKDANTNSSQPIVVPDNHSEIIEKSLDKTVPKIEKKKFLSKYKYDAALLLIICIMFGVFYVTFGAFVPIVVVVSESMDPHIQKGDMIFYNDISKVDKIETYDKQNSINFEDYGDVIIYKPFGQEEVVPYVHRAMYHVNQGDEMWSGGKKAPHTGYITKGDNVDTNRMYDQQGSISKDTPIKRDWIIGIAKFRVPYIGYIRLMLS